MNQMCNTASWSSVRAFWSVLSVRHRETASHSALVSSIAVKIGRVIGLDREQLVQLRMGALLHDIGKLAIPDAVLSKPAKLNKLEWEIVMQHPTIGYSLLGSANPLGSAAYVILSHHERYDGQGYPFGLIGDNIHLLARLCAVADSLAAMLIDRPYRKKVPISAALAEVQRCRGTQFDPMVVDALQLIDMEKISHSSLFDENYLTTMLRQEKGSFGGSILANTIYSDFSYCDS